MIDLPVAQFRRICGFIDLFGVDEPGFFDMCFLYFLGGSNS
jgi:hypothetical protein